MPVARLAALLLFLALPVAAGILELPTDSVQGALVVGRTEPDAVVRFDGRDFRVSPEGWFVIGFGREAPPWAQVEVRFADGGWAVHEIAVAPRVWEIQRIDGLAPNLVTPSPTELTRIRHEAALVAAARGHDRPLTEFLAGFRWPAEGPVSGVYGSQRILNGAPRQPHYGLDIAAPRGAPVAAPAGGVVTLAAPDLYFTGGTLVIDHGHGVSSTFSHLDRLDVGEGQVVARGQVVGAVGATGRATGPHLDWRINLFDLRLDPELVVPRR
ncbi:MAG: M23 family peptidase [Alphaproteobacteria bacterium]|nr:M23 family peptidase [Alphaproteobacteria bacterium]